MVKAISQNVHSKPKYETKNIVQFHFVRNSHKMCNANGTKCKIPICGWFVIAICVIAAVAGAIHGITLLTSSYEKDESENVSEKETDKDTADNESLTSTLKNTK